jgi:hypothetical protein
MVTGREAAPRVTDQRVECIGDAVARDEGSHMIFCGVIGADETAPTIVAAKSSVKKSPAQHDKEQLR